MGKINNYATVAPSLSDKIIVTDVSNNDETKNVLVIDILNLGSNRAQFTNIVGGVAPPISSGTATALTWLASETFNIGFTIASSTTIISSVAGIFNFRLEFALTKASSPITSPYVIGAELLINSLAVSGSRRISNVPANMLTFVSIFNIAASVSIGDIIQLNIRTQDATLTGYTTATVNVGSGSGGVYPAHLLLITKI